jgi:hypothetical protein
MGYAEKVPPPALFSRTIEKRLSLTMQGLPYQIRGIGRDWLPLALLPAAQTPFRHLRSEVVGQCSSGGQNGREEIQSGGQAGHRSMAHILRAILVCLRSCTKGRRAYILSLLPLDLREYLDNEPHCGAATYTRFQ